MLWACGFDAIAIVDADELDIAGPVAVVGLNDRHGCCCLRGVLIDMWCGRSSKQIFCEWRVLSCSQGVRASEEYSRRVAEWGQSIDHVR